MRFYVNEFGDKVIVAYCGFGRDDQLEVGKFFVVLEGRDYF
jgi:hypothetical protein